MQRKNLLLAIVLLCTLFVIPFVGSKTNMKSIEISNPIDMSIVSYVEHSPINITSDDDFLAQKVSEGWIGNGTESNPYIIQGYNITYKGYKIIISDVSAYFVIMNCYLPSQTGAIMVDPYDNGVALFNVSHGSIVNNTILDNIDSAIYLGSSTSLVVNNTLIGNRLGVTFQNSSGEVRSNEIDLSSEYSFYILDSAHIDIRNNNVNSEGWQELLMLTSFDCSIEYNTFNQNHIVLQQSSNCTIVRNRLFNGSMIAVHSTSDILVKHNRIYNSLSYGIEVELSINITVSSNKIISSLADGIFAYRSEDCLYTGNQIMTCLNGIRIVDEVSSTFTYNSIAFQQHLGISLGSGSDNQLYGNILSNDGRGPAGDEGSDNLWDDGEFIGNFWEGIEDVILRVSGAARSIDNFARRNDDAPFSYHIHDIPLVRVFGENAATLSWIVWSDGPFTYDIVRNRILIDAGYRDGSGHILVNINNLPDGLYTYKLNINPLDVMIDPPVESIFNITIPHLWFIDSDSDMMPDNWETANGLNPLVDDAGWDTDLDDLFNLDEYLLGTDPQNPDSDFDLIFDGWEVRYWLDPLDDSDALLDLDSDSLTNLQEFELGTDPSNSDTDFDNFPDAWEVSFGFDPTNPVVPLLEYFTFYSPIITVLSIIVIGVVGVFYIKHKQEIVHREKLTKEEEEDKLGALEELLD